MSLCIYPLLKHKLGFLLFQCDMLCILPGVVSPGTLYFFFIIMISASERLITKLVIFIVTFKLEQPCTFSLYPGLVCSVWRHFCLS